ncbi:MAG: hypothetical protein GQ474_08005 [Sulfurimonas sp.]|nr:hypothetical protein [Sulfurimonas sp.]
MKELNADAKAHIEESGAVTIAVNIEGHEFKKDDILAIKQLTPDSIELYVFPTVVEKGRWK